MPPREIRPDMFKPIEYPRREIAGAGLKRYRVYRDKENFTLIEAENAKAALEASGLKEARRVVRDIIFLKNVVKLDAAAPAAPPASPESAPAPASDS